MLNLITKRKWTWMAGIFLANLAYRKFREHQGATKDSGRANADSTLKAPLSDFAASGH